MPRPSIAESKRQRRNRIRKAAFHRRPLIDGRVIALPRIHVFDIELRWGSVRENFYGYAESLRVWRDHKVERHGRPDAIEIRRREMHSPYPGEIIVQRGVTDPRPARQPAPFLLAAE